MSDVFPVGFEGQPFTQSVSLRFDAAFYADGEHRAGLVQTMDQWSPTLYGSQVIGGEAEALIRALSGPKANVLGIQMRFTERVHPMRVCIENADILQADDMWAFVFFLAGFITSQERQGDQPNPSKIWFVLSPKDETIAALKASTQAKRSPRLLAIMLHKLGAE